MKNLKPLNLLIMLLVAYLVYRWIESILFPRPTKRKQPFTIAIDHRGNAPQGGGANNYYIHRSQAASPRAYNNVKQEQISHPQTLELAPGTVHSYSYTVYGGECDIEIDGHSLTYYDGDFGDDTATDTIRQSIKFIPQAGASVRVKTVF